MTHVFLFIHANLAVREGFQQSQEWRHIGKLPLASVETSSCVDNGRCTLENRKKNVSIWNSRFGSVHHPIIQSSQEQSSWQSHLTDMTINCCIPQLTPWLDLGGMKLLVKVPTSGWFPTTFFDLVQKRKDWWRKDLKAEVNPLGWHPKIVETYQLIGWYHLSSPSADWMTSFCWKMKLDYDSHLYLPHVTRGTRIWLQPFPHQRHRQVAKAFLQQFMEPRWTAPIVSSATQTWRFSWCTAKWGSAVTSPKSTAPHEGSWKSVGRIVWGVGRCTQ